MDQQQGQGETFAAAVHYFRRMVCLRFMVRQALFATDEIDDELPSFEFNNRNWQHRMFLMRQTLLDLNHLCDREIQRAQQHLQTFVTTDYQNQWYWLYTKPTLPFGRLRVHSRWRLDIPQFEFKRISCVASAFAVMSVMSKLH